MSVNSPVAALKLAALTAKGASEEPLETDEFIDLYVQDSEAAVRPLGDLLRDGHCNTDIVDGSGEVIVVNRDVLQRDIIAYYEEYGLDEVISDIGPEQFGPHGERLLRYLQQADGAQPILPASKLPLLLTDNGRYLITYETETGPRLDVAATVPDGAASFVDLDKLPAA